MRLVEITPEEYEALRLAGVWVQWTPGGYAPNQEWNSSHSSVDRFLGMDYVSFWTRVDDDNACS